MSAANKRSGVALVVCAPSGAGKTTLIKRLKEKYPHFAFSVSCTTREPRQDEVHGLDYEFLSREEFLARRENGFFAEWAEVHGNFYGTPLDATRKLLSEGQDVIFDIDVQGAIQLRDTIAGAHFVYILPPSRAELERRLMSRGTESPENLSRRLSAARKELAEAAWFDAWIVNDELETAFTDLEAAYLGATLSPQCRKDFFSALMHEWDE